MLKNSKKFSILCEKAREFYNKHKKEIIDIIIFGSFVKGEILPKDIDICIIFRDKLNEDMAKSLGDELTKDLNVHISLLLVDNFFLKSHSLAKTLLEEGVSLINKKSLSENLGFSQNVLYSYSLKGKEQKEKTKIVYVLKGRDKKPGFVVSVGGEWLTDSCFIVPVNFDNEATKILKKWQVKYGRKNVLIG